MGQKPSPSLRWARTEFLGNSDVSGRCGGGDADLNVDWWVIGGGGGARLGGWVGVLVHSPALARGGRCSEVAEQFIFLAPVHLRGPLATALLVGPLFSHSQGDVEVQDGVGGGGGR